MVHAVWFLWDRHCTRESKPIQHLLWISAWVQASPHNAGSRPTNISFSNFASFSLTFTTFSTHDHFVKTSVVSVRLVFLSACSSFYSLLWFCGLKKSGPRITRAVQMEVSCRCAHTLVVSTNHHSPIESSSASASHATADPNKCRLSRDKSLSVRFPLNRHGRSVESRRGW